ncbi:MAG: hypothetical protein AB7I59_02810 [Geminicoccaceae bacterium]
MHPRTASRRAVDPFDPALQDHVLEALLPGAGAGLALCLLLFLLLFAI